MKRFFPHFSPLFFWQVYVLFPHSQRLRFVPQMLQTTAEPAVLVCEYCGQSDMICVDEYYASWYTVNFIPCQGRDPRYNDSVENRTHVEIYQCQSCMFGTSVVSTEEQISHKHPAMRAYDLPRF